MTLPPNDCRGQWILSETTGIDCLRLYEEEVTFPSRYGIVLGDFDDECSYLAFVSAFPANFQL